MSNSISCHHRLHHYFRDQLIVLCEYNDSGHFCILVLYHNKIDKTRHSLRSCAVLKIPSTPVSIARSLETGVDIQILYFDVRQEEFKHDELLWTHHMTWSLVLGSISLRVRSSMKRFTVSNLSFSPGSKPSESCKINRLLLLWRNSVLIFAFPGQSWETSYSEGRSARRGSGTTWTLTACSTPKTLLINDDFPHPV